MTMPFGALTNTALKRVGTLAGTPTAAQAVGSMSGVLPQIPGATPPTLSGGTPATAIPNVTAAGLPQFGATPGSNLLSSQIAPNPSQRLTSAQGLTDTAAQKYAGMTPQAFTAATPANTAGSQSLYEQAQQFAKAQGNPQSFDLPAGLAGDLGGVNSQMKGLLDKIVSGPDRGKLAADQYALLQERDAPRFQQDLQAVGRKAGALGRVGAGFTTSEFGDVATLRNRALEQGARQLSLDTAGQTLNDQLAALEATQSVGKGLGSQAAGYYGAMGDANEQANRARQQSFENLFALGQNKYGQERDAYGDTVSERDKGLGYDRDLFDRARTQLGDLDTYGRGIDASERADRDELRTERGTQYGMSRDAIEDNVRQRLLEDQLLNSRFGRGTTASQLGFGANPSGAFQDAAQQYGQQAGDSYAGLESLFAQSGQRAGALPRRAQAPVGTPVGTQLPDDLYYG